jgi:glucosylceramidase
LILAFDHNKDHLELWADEMFNKSAAASSYVDGIAFHWYSGSGDRLMDGTFGYNTVNATHAKYPGKILLATEGCSCPGVEVGSWFRGERLGHDIMFDLLNWAQGWIDWNLIVNR